MEDVLLNALQAVIIAIIPIITGFIVNALRKFADKIKAETNSAYIKMAYDELEKAITEAVTHTSQTYVSDLKKSNTFTIENQKVALTNAKNTALSLLSNRVYEFLNETVTDLPGLIEKKIEAVIGATK